MPPQWLKYTALNLNLLESHTWSDSLLISLCGTVHGAGIRGMLFLVLIIDTFDHYRSLSQVIRMYFPCPHFSFPFLLVFTKWGRHSSKFCTPAMKEGKKSRGRRSGASIFSGTETAGTTQQNQHNQINTVRNDFSTCGSVKKYSLTKSFKTIQVGMVSSRYFNATLTVSVLFVTSLGKTM